MQIPPLPAACVKCLTSATDLLDVERCSIYGNVSQTSVVVQVWQTQYAKAHCKLNNLGARYSSKKVRSSSTRLQWCSPTCLLHRLEASCVV